MTARSTTAPTTGRPPSPRSVRTRRAVLDATGALMAEGGLAAATVDGIRDRSGVSKTTIYKHWPNRLCVAVDAFADRLAQEASLPDTGTARGDFTEQIRRISAFYASPLGSVFTQLLASAVQDPDASERLQARLLASRQNGIQELWGRAVARGEVRDDVDPDIAIDLLFGPVMWRLVRRNGPLADDEADAITDAALAGLLTRTGRRPPAAPAPRHREHATRSGVGRAPDELDAEQR